MYLIIFTLLVYSNVIENPNIISIRSHKRIQWGLRGSDIIRFVCTWELWRRIFSGESSANDFLPFVAAADKHDVCAHASIIRRKCFFVYERRERKNTHTYTPVGRRSGVEREKGGGNARRRDPRPHILTATPKIAAVEALRVFL